MFVWYIHTFATDVVAKHWSIPLTVLSDKYIHMFNVLTICILWNDCFDITNTPVSLTPSSRLIWHVQHLIWGVLWKYRPQSHRSMLGELWKYWRTQKWPAAWKYACLITFEIEIIKISSFNTCKNPYPYNCICCYLTQFPLYMALRTSWIHQVTLFIITAWNIFRFICIVLPKKIIIICIFHCITSIKGSLMFVLKELGIESGYHCTAKPHVTSNTCENAQNYKCSRKCSWKYNCFYSLAILGCLRYILVINSVTIFVLPTISWIIIFHHKGHCTHL